MSLVADDLLLSSTSSLLLMINVLILLFFHQVCDEPHPVLIKEMLQQCVKANFDEAYKVRAE